MKIQNKFLSTISERIKPLNIAHRGGMGLYPENTMFAFNSVIHEHNVDALEIDLQLTKDNIPIIIHDSTIDRTTNGKGKVRDLTFDELQSFDAGYNFTVDNGKTFPFRGMNITIPSLEEFLYQFSNILINIEIKYNSLLLIIKTKKLLKKFRAYQNVIIGSGMIGVSRKMQPYFLKCGLFFSRIDIYLFAIRNIIGVPNKYFEKFDVLEIPMFSNNFHVLNYFNKLIKKSSLPVFVWGVDNFETIQDAVNKKVNGLITDRPDLVNLILYNK